MIDIKSLIAEWIAEKRQKYSKDPSLMESMIHALYLLEQLQLTGLDFIFKGGTSSYIYIHCNEKSLKRFIAIFLIVNRVN